MPNNNASINMDDRDDRLVAHHYNNIATGNSVLNENGSLSTIRSTSVGINGRTYVLPTVWEGKIVDIETAINNAKNAEGGLSSWPNFPDTEEGISEAGVYDQKIHNDHMAQGQPHTTSEQAQQWLNTDRSIVDLENQKRQAQAIRGY
jgi:hypothetical protein